MQVGVERILVFRRHVFIDVQVHVVQNLNQGVAHVEDVLAGNVSEVAVIQLGDTGHDLGGELLTFFGEEDVILLGTLGLPVVVNEFLLPEGLDDTVGVGRIEIEETGKADHGLPIL